MPAERNRAKRQAPHRKSRMNAFMIEFLKQSRLPLDAEADTQPSCFMDSKEIWLSRKNDQNFMINFLEIIEIIRTLLINNAKI